MNVKKMSVEFRFKNCKNGFGLFLFCFFLFVCLFVCFVLYWVLFCLGFCFGVVGVFFFRFKSTSIFYHVRVPLCQYPRACSIMPGFQHVFVP